MVESLEERQNASVNDTDNLQRKVNSRLLKLFFRQKKNSNELVGDSEIVINIRGTLKGPDQLGNYVMSFDGKKFLLDENLNDVIGLEFVGIMPYNDRYYICDLGKKCVFYDTDSGNVVEFAELGHVVKAKIYGKDELSNDEFLSDLCNKSIILSPNQSKESLILLFYTFLHRYYRNILKKEIDIESQIQEASKFGKECNSIFCFLMGAYEYMYNGKITKFLAGKDTKLWEELKNSETLKEMFPDLYLAMYELDFLKNVLLDDEGNIRGYVIVKEGSCYVYLTKRGVVLEYDDFRGPDMYGNFITKKNGKKYFIGTNFKYVNCGFDEIKGPDKNGNYILTKGDKQCLVLGSSQKMFNLYGNENVGNEPAYEEKFYSIDGPDDNNNYIVHGACYFLLNSSGKIISKFYFLFERLENGKYHVCNMECSKDIDGNGEI